VLCGKQIAEVLRGAGGGLVGDDQAPAAEQRDEDLADRDVEGQRVPL